MSELDIDNDQSILNHTQAIPSEKHPGAITLSIDMPIGTPMTHSELAREQFKEIAGKWCEAVRQEVKNRELEKQAQARIASLRAKEAQMAAKLPESEQARDAAQERRIIVPAGTLPPIGELRPGKIQVVANDDPLAYAKQQYVYWSEEESKLEHATKMRTKWERVLQVLRGEDNGD